MEFSPDFELDLFEEKCPHFGGIFYSLFYCTAKQKYYRFS